MVDDRVAEGGVARSFTVSGLTHILKVIRMIGALPTCGMRAGWQSGHAADCNSVYAGSIPTPASNL